MKKIKNLYAKIITAWISMLIFLANLPKALADSNPFGGDTITPDELEGKAGTTLSSTLEYVLLTIGVLACVACTMNIARAISRSAEEKQEHGSSIKVIMLNVFGLFIGIACIGIGWKGASTKVT
jgi:hypothetical protein